MNMSVRITHILLFTALVTACGSSDPTTVTSSPGSEPKTAIGKAANRAIGEARQELATENIGLSSSDDTSKAEITPKGDWLIDGKVIAIDDKQRGLLLDYRKQTHAVAEAGMAIGVQGADLAGKAIGEAIGSIFSGESEQQIEKKIEAEAKGIEASATKLCDLLPGLFEAQNKLADSLPTFKPYANMTQKDIDECRIDSSDKNGGEAIGRAIESAFNQKVDVKVDIDADSSDGQNAAEEAEAASAASTEKK